MSSFPFSRPRVNDRRPAAAPSGAAAPAGPTLGDALADIDLYVLRIRYRLDSGLCPYRDLAAFSSGFRRLFFDAVDYAVDRGIRADLIEWALEEFPAVDWTRDHDVHLACGHVRSTPQCWEPGYIPEDDLEFGGGPALLLAAVAPAPALAAIGGR